MLGYNFPERRVTKFDDSHRQFGFARSSTARLRQIPAQCGYTLPFTDEGDVLVRGVRINRLRGVANMGMGSNDLDSVTAEA